MWSSCVLQKNKNFLCENNSGFPNAKVKRDLRVEKMVELKILVLHSDKKSQQICIIFSQLQGLRIFINVSWDDRDFENRTVVDGVQILTFKNF